VQLLRKKCLPVWPLRDQYPEQEPFVLTLVRTGGVFVLHENLVYHYPCTDQEIKCGGNSYSLFQQ
jgi:hypothetical protein